MVCNSSCNSEEGRGGVCAACTGHGGPGPQPRRREHPASEQARGPLSVSNRESKTEKKEGGGTHRLQVCGAHGLHRHAGETVEEGAGKALAAASLSQRVLGGEDAEGGGAHEQLRGRARWSQL